jgi:DMSO reductase anchor subunit
VLRGVKWFFLLAVFPVPLCCCWPGMQGASAVLVGAFAMQYLGLLAERWFFFAQANHPQNLYYQSIA